jgi:hypothetical protein
MSNWRRRLERIDKVKEPLGRAENVPQLRIIAAFVTGLLFRAFKYGSGFKGTCMSLSRPAVIWHSYLSDVYPATCANRSRLRGYYLNYHKALPIVLLESSLNITL